MDTLPRALAGIVRHNGGRPAMVDADGTLTWREFGDRVAKAAGALRALGMKPGERFALVARNSRRFEELKWGGIAAGLVPVPVNWRLAPPEIAHVLADAECRAAFVEDEFAAAFADAALARWRHDLVALPGGSDALIAAAAPAAAHDAAPDDDALLLYTGGTTGRSKGVRLSHRNILANAVAFGLGVGARRDDTFLHVAPMFHSADLLATAWFQQGARHLYLPAFTPAAFAAAVRDQGATATVTVPTMLMATVADPGFDAAAFRDLRTLIYGAAPMPLAGIRRVAAAFPRARLFNCYGLTETAPDLTIFDADEFRAAIASGAENGPALSVGKPNALNELRVVRPDGRDAAPGEAGELWARGPNMMKGYLNLPDETAKAFAGEWLRTGDVARIDEEGYVYLLDRLKDLVISGGENIYTSEVEAVLNRHPAVLEAAVFGVPDERLGEALVAAVQARPGQALAADDVIAFCRGKIGGYKIPRRVEIAAALPRSALGKVLKSELRRTYAAKT
jgi:long-chain acyl-CoA synthetase